MNLVSMQAPHHSLHGTKILWPCHPSGLSFHSSPLTHLAADAMAAALSLNLPSMLSAGITAPIRCMLYPRNSVLPDLPIMSPTHH